MTTALLLLAVVLGAGPSDEKPSAVGSTPDLVAGKLPDDPARALLRGKCLICHSADYVTQQRLTPAQWQKTVEKMRKFGAPMNDAEAEHLASYLGRNWTVELPERRPAPVRAPRSAVSAPAPR